MRWREVVEGWWYLLEEWRTASVMGRLPAIVVEERWRPKERGTVPLKERWLAAMLAEDWRRWRIQRRIAFVLRGSAGRRCR
ncbi:hypothetical protein ACR2V4_26960 [Klebsiella pneumoniae]